MHARSRIFRQLASSITLYITLVNWIFICLWKLRGNNKSRINLRNKELARVLKYHHCFLPTRDYGAKVARRPAGASHVERKNESGNCHLWLAGSTDDDSDLDGDTRC
jgi:hypothetical protein